MKAVQTFSLLLLVAIFGLSDSAAISETKREIPRIWQQIKDLSKEDRVLLKKNLMNPSSTRNVLDDQIIAAILDFVHRPEMDPYLIPHVGVNIVQDGIRINGSLDNVSVSGLSALQVDKLHVNILLLKADFAFTLPSLVATGDYDIDASMDNSLFLFGKGPFQIDLTGLKASGTGHAGLSGGSIVVKSLDLNLGLEKIHFNAQHLMGDDEISDYLNELINEAAPFFLNEYEAMIENTVSTFLVNWINSKLSGTKVNE